MSWNRRRRLRLNGFKETCVEHRAEEDKGEPLPEYVRRRNCYGTLLQVSGLMLQQSAEEREHDIVTENDLAHLLHLLEGKDGEMEWQRMMERTTSNMSYQEPDVGIFHFLVF
ncbi:hypothetical protein V6N13_128940 [Hibiscus sabdariffa]